MRVPRSLTIATAAVAAVLAGGTSAQACPTHQQGLDKYSASFQYASGEGERPSHDVFSPGVTPIGHPHYLEHMNTVRLRRDGLPTEVAHGTPLTAVIGRLARIFTGNPATNLKGGGDGVYEFDGKMGAGGNKEPINGFVSIFTQPNGTNEIVISTEPRDPDKAPNRPDAADGTTRCNADDEFKDRTNRTPNNPGALRDLEVGSGLKPADDVHAVTSISMHNPLISEDDTQVDKSNIIAQCLDRRDGEQVLGLPQQLSLDTGLHAGTIRYPDGTIKPIQVTLNSGDTDGRGHKSYSALFEIDPPQDAGADKFAHHFAHHGEGSRRHPRVTTTTVPTNREDRRRLARLEGAKKPEQGVVTA